MKKIIIIIAIFIAITHLAESLAPIRAVLRNSGNNLSVELNDYSTGSAVAVSTDFGTKDLDPITPNSSGIVTLVIGEGDEDWGDIMPSQINPNVILDVFDDGTLVAQFRIDELIEESALGSQLPSNVNVGGNLEVDTNMTVGGDVVIEGETKVKGDMIVKGVLKMNSNTFKNANQLGQIVNNIMVFNGTNNKDFEESDLSNDLPNNAVYILVNDSEDNYFSLDLDEGGMRYAGVGETISIIKIGGKFFYTTPGFSE